MQRLTRARLAPFVRVSFVTGGQLLPLLDYSVQISPCSIIYYKRDLRRGTRQLTTQATLLLLWKRTCSSWMNRLSTTWQRQIAVVVLFVWRRMIDTFGEFHLVFETQTPSCSIVKMELLMPLPMTAKQIFMTAEFTLDPQLGGKKRQNLALGSSA